MKKAACLASLFLFAAGCASLEQTVVQQAAFDTKCPPDKIQVVAWGPDRRSAEVTACGQPHRYTNVTSYNIETPSEPHWVETK